MVLLVYYAKNNTILDLVRSSIFNTYIHTHIHIVILISSTKLCEHGYVSIDLMINDYDGDSVYESHRTCLFADCFIHISVLI